MDELRIRTARAEDIGVLAALMTDLGYPSSVEDMGRRFEGIAADPSYATLVAEREGVVLGTIGLHLEHFYEHDFPCARIMAFVVASEYRGQGVGWALISAAEDWARQRGATDVMLTTHKRRTGAHRFYRKMGNEATGYRFYKSLVNDNR
jgi:GNAT superfamily N-acetyltransferase